MQERSAMQETDLKHQRESTWSPFMKPHSCQKKVLGRSLATVYIWDISLVVRKQDKEYFYRYQQSTRDQDTHMRSCCLLSLPRAHVTFLQLSDTKFRRVRRESRKGLSVRKYNWLNIYPKRYCFKYITIHS